MARRVQTNLILFILIIIGFIGGLTWINYQFAINNPGGNDFLAHYVGAKALIFEGISPYSDQVAEKIQTLVFGREAQSGEIEHRVVYPIYSVLIFAPFALIKNYTIARVAWMTFMEVALFYTSYLALNLTKWKPKISILIIYYLFSMLWYHSFRGVINGNAVILVSLFVTGALYAIKEGKDKIAGLLLAFSTIKPNLVVLVILVVLIWCIYQRRSTVIYWFFGSLLVFTLGGMLIIPDWIKQNLWEILKYPAYNPAGSIGVVVGNWFPGIKLQVQWTISVGLGLILAYEWWSARKKEFDRFLWTVCLTLVISQWIGITTDPGNFVILFTPFVLLLANLDNRWEKYGTAIVATIMGVVFFGLWILFIATLDFEYQPMQSSVMFFPFPGLVLLGLYWIKWWFTGSKPLLWNDFK